MSKSTAALIGALLGMAIGLASHRAAIAEISALPTIQRVDTPYWSITLQSDVIDLFPSFDQKLKFSREPARSIADILDQSGLPDHDEKQWPIAQQAKSDGLFALTTAMIFIDEFTLNSLAASDLKSPLFQDIDPKGSPKSDLVIQIYKDEVTFKQATGALGPESANGLFLADTNTIATFLPASFLEGFYRPFGQLQDLTEQGASAIIALRRTLGKTYQHELIHALQQRSGRYYLQSPFIAEGQAQFLTKKLGRLEILGPMVAAQFLADQSVLGQQRSFASLTAAMNRIRRNSVLSPEEYEISRRIASLPLGDGEQLSFLLTVKSDDFYSSRDVARYYDLAWGLFFLLDSEQDPAQDFSMVRHVAENLDASRYQSQIKDIESRLRDLVRNTLGPEKDYTAALLALPAAVNKSDAEMLQKRPFAAYEQLLSSLKAAPTAPDVLAYVADLFTSEDARDVYATLYNRALDEQDHGAQATIGSPLRLLGRYVDTLMRAGLINQAASKIAAAGDLNKAQLTQLDIPTRSNLLLISHYLRLRDQASDADRAKLECEANLGRAIQAYDELSTSDLMKNALRATDSVKLPQLKSVYENALGMARSAVQRDAIECGIARVEPNSWFIGPELAGLQDRLDEINQLIAAPRK
ncbi:hypothetical protein MTR72_37840 [Bradyrhizobium sp. ISRA442]|uniref:hypothetical protein n=1 Tax=Bradyrhizobium sp. ISRA442 TaxID=2866197 RepID=UPI00311B430B